MSHHIVELDENTTELAYPALKELRPHLAGPAEFAEQVRLQRTEGYRLAVAHDADGTVVSAAGFRLVTSLAWGQHIYIDDLCTLPAARGQGHASALLEWVDAEALRLGLTEVHLDSGTHRHAAHRRYLSSGYVIPAFHFRKELGAP
ncbi:GNAT family N-acetyltransferase [Kibdelosporangium phytohabitans]|uniref:GNAT family N-acetyltransferase n=1 Tax=Kibdelosporangium phytohabitans TaxID=860235 RepID=UPI0019E9E9ED|nr:GNAT family N-acetyltransferase [Kibdelosporangium phytohabitans]MBE1469359.1 GNAT superfamily N-acetyltransferase [Kibdelosporangium phytohabitans]